MAGPIAKAQPGSLEELIASFDQKEEEARLSNLSRENQVRAIYDQVIQRYQSGGAFEQAGEAMIGRRKTQDVGARTQHAIGSGLFNTQATGAIGQSWEQDVGAGMRLNMQDTMMQRLSQAQLGKADFITGIENRYPDSNALSDMAGRYGAAAGGDNRGVSLWDRDPGTTYAEQKAINSQTNRQKTADASSYGSTGQRRPGYNSKGVFSPELLKMQTEAGMTGTTQAASKPTGSVDTNMMRRQTGAPTTYDNPRINVAGQSLGLNYASAPRYKDTRKSALKGGAMFR